MQSASNSSFSIDEAKKSKPVKDDKRSLKSPAKGVSSSKDFNETQSNKAKHLSESEITKFAKSVADKKYMCFVEAIEVEKLETLKRNGIKLANISSILKGAGTKANEAFEGLYESLFAKDGEKTRLEVLKENGVYLAHISSILCGAGSKAKQAFEGLYESLFVKEGEQTRLQFLKDNGMKLSYISSMLSGSGAKGKEAFEGIYECLMTKIV